VSQNAGLPLPARTKKVALVIIKIMII